MFQHHVLHRMLHTLNGTLWNDSIKTKLKTQNDTFMNLPDGRMWKMLEPPGKKPQKHIPIMIQAFDSLHCLASLAPPRIASVIMSREETFYLLMGRLKPQRTPFHNQFPSKKVKQSLEWRLKHWATFIIKLEWILSCFVRNSEFYSVFSEKHAWRVFWDNCFTAILEMQQKLVKHGNDDSTEILSNPLEFYEKFLATQHLKQASWKRWHPNLLELENFHLSQEYF